MTDEELLFDEWAEEVSNEIIKDFKAELLASYYLDNPDLAASASWALAEAKGLLTTHPSAAHVFATATIEVVIKSVLLKPMIIGCVHVESVANVIASIALGQTGITRFKDLLFKMLNDLTSIDLSTYARPDSGTTLWSEINTIQKERNSVVHRANSVTSNQAETAVAVAEFVLDQIFRSVVATLGLSITEEYKVI